MALTTEEKKEIITKYSQAKGDTGSPEIQVAILSKELEKLQSHLGENKHDSRQTRSVKQNCQTPPSFTLPSKS